MYLTDTGMLIQCYMIQYTHVHHVHVHVHVHSTTPLSPTVMLNSLYTVISHNNIHAQYMNIILTSVHVLHKRKRHMCMHAGMNDSL